MDISSRTIQTTALVAVATTLVIAAWLWKKKRKVYVKVGKISKIYLYPVKSLRGIEIDKAYCNKKGLLHQSVQDRCFMLVGGDSTTYTTISLMEEPSLALLDPKISGNKLLISGPGMEMLEIDLQKDFSKNNNVVECSFYSFNTKAEDSEEEASRWFQKYLKRTDVRFVRYVPQLHTRELKKEIKIADKFEKYPAAFQNLSAFNITTQPSIDNLNSKLDEKVTARNFRPNLVIDGCNPQDEDTWKYIKTSNGVEFLHLFPCFRCTVTTVNPDTGIKTNKNPLATLRKYRMAKDPKLKSQVGYSPCFSVDCGLLKEGEISVGDDVFAVIEHGLLKL